MPAQRAKDIPNSPSLYTVLKTKNPINAPTGSARPEQKDNQNALDLFLVA